MQNNKYKSALGTAKGLGGTNEGVHHWINERIAALALLPLALWLVVSIVSLVGASYNSVIEWFANPVNAVLMILFVGVSSYHAAYGLQVILEDYVRSHFARMTAIVLVKAVFLVLAVATIFSILKIAL